jgi:hypothetical protein
VARSSGPMAEAMLGSMAVIGSGCRLVNYKPVMFHIPSSTALRTLQFSYLQKAFPAAKLVARNGAMPATSAAYTYMCMELAVDEEVRFACLLILSTASLCSQHVQVIRHPSSASLTIDPNQQAKLTQPQSAAL